MAYIAWRSRRVHATGDRILLSSLLMFAALLALLDQTKTPLYASILLPSLCMAMAALWMAALRWVLARGQPVWLRLATGAASVGLAFTIGWEAVHVTTHAQKGLQPRQFQDVQYDQETRRAPAAARVYVARPSVGKTSCSQQSPRGL